MELRALTQDLCDAKHPSRHGEANLVSGEGKAVHAVGILLIGGPGVLGEHALQGGALLRGDAREQFRREIDLQMMGDGLRRVAVRRVCVDVGEGDVGLDVQYGRCLLYTSRGV